MSEPAQRGAIAWMASHPIAANLAMLLLLFGGVWSAITVRKEVYPEFQLDVVEVSVRYPGASPEEVEAGILMPVEDAVLGISGVEEVSSEAREGTGTVRLELLTGADRMQTLQEVDQAVSRINTFPDEAEEPRVALESRQRGVLVINFYGEVDAWTLRQLAERAQERLLSDPRITQVALWRVPEYVTHVEIPQDRLRAHGLTLGEVAQRVSRSSRDIPAGAMETDQGELLLRLKDRRRWAEELAEIPIITASNGGVVRLGELGEVTDGFEDVGFHGQFNQQPAINIQVYRVGEQSPLEIAAAVEEILAELEETLPPGVQTRIDRNEAEDFRDRLGLLLENGVMALVIVLGILALFLELRLSFWIMMGMATSFVGGVMLLPAVDVSVNMISMFGFLVVLGIVVDDAVVVGENVQALRERGVPPLEAAVAGAKEMAGPVTVSILTNIVAFVPVMLLPGETGKYWWPLPVVVTLVLLLSLAEALFILPAHLSHAAPEPRFGLTRRVARSQRAFSERLSRFVQARYRPLLQTLLANRYVTLSASLALLIIAGGYSLSEHLGMILMPQVAADEIEAGIRLPVGTTQRQAAAVAEEVTQATLHMFEVHGLHAVAEGVKTNVRRENFIDVEIVMRPPDERDMSAAEVIALWRDNIGDIEGVDQITFEAERGPGGARPDISVDLSHADPEQLASASAAFKEEVQRLQAAVDVGDSYRRGKPQLDIHLLPEGRLLGLDPVDVGGQVRDAFFGALALRHLRGTNEVEVRVRLPEAERQAISSFQGLMIRTPSGTEAPLSELAAVTRDEAYASLDRRGGRRVITVSFDTEPKSAMGRVMRLVDAELLPRVRADFPGLTWSFQGSQAEMRESTASLYGSFGMSLLAIFALLAVSFRSYTQPLIVLAAVPFGLVGATLGHGLMGYELSLVSLMGMVALAGVVVNDSLILVHHAERVRGGLGSAEAAVVEAGVRRFRPILLTTATTFGGLIPIISETSRQAANVIPMAISLGFGIVFGTAITLVIVPCLYLALEDVEGVLKR